MAIYQHVFSPIKIGPLTIMNRIEISPAVPCLANENGMVTEALIAYYRSLGRSGAGIVTIGDSAVDFCYGKEHEAQLNLGDDRILPGLHRLVQAIERTGAVASIEVNHGGRFSAPGLLEGRNPIAPSSIPSNAELMFAGIEGRRSAPVDAMTQAQIDMVVEQYAHAVYNCYQAGFRMVMLHGAHGHMLAQFMSPLANKRNDHYGGSLENRARFPIQVLDAIRKKVGRNMAIEYRISADELVPEGMMFDEIVRFVKMIEDKIDLLHVSVGVLSEPDTNPDIMQPIYYPRGMNVHWAEKMKKNVNLPITTVGSITMDMAEDIIRDGKADMVAMMRNFLADSQYANKMRHGDTAQVRPCIRCNVCTQNTANFYPILCAVNPLTGRETEYTEPVPVKKTKKVVVIGGGPAGMEAAQIAAQRGHSVVLFEKEERLGGALNYAAGPGFKADIKKYLVWMIDQTMMTQGLTIRMNTEATAENIGEENPDAIIVAVGAKPFIPQIPGIDGKNVVWSGNVDLGTSEVGKRVVVAGGGLTGGETALSLAQEGREVTIIDMIPATDFAKDAPIISKIGLQLLHKKYNVKYVGEVKLEGITESGAAVIDRNWRRYEIPADTVVLSLGLKVDSEARDQFRGLAADVFFVGDCKAPRNVKAAVHEGFNSACEL